MAVVPGIGIAQGHKPPAEVVWSSGQRQAVFHIPLQNVPVGQFAVLMGPIGSLLPALEIGILQNGFFPLGTDGIRNLPQAVMIGHMVFKFPSGFEGHRIHHHVVVNIVRVQMGGDHNLILIAPHLSSGLHAYAVSVKRIS